MFRCKQLDKILDEIEKLKWRLDSLESLLENEFRKAVKETVDVARCSSQRAYIDYVLTQYRRSLVTLYHTTVSVKEQVLEPVECRIGLSTGSQCYRVENAVFIPVIAYYDSEEAFEIKIYNAMNTEIFNIVKPEGQKWAPLVKMTGYHELLIVLPGKEIRIVPQPRKIVAIIAEPIKEMNK